MQKHLYHLYYFKREATDQWLMWSVGVAVRDWEDGDRDTQRSEVTPLADPGELDMDREGGTYGMAAVQPVKERKVRAK